MPWPTSPTIDQTYQPDAPDGSTYVYRGDGKWDVQIPPAAATLAEYYTKTEEDALHDALEAYADAAVADRVEGPASATDDYLVRFSGTTGKLVDVSPVLASSSQLIHERNGGVSNIVGSRTDTHGDNATVASYTGRGRSDAATERNYAALWFTAISDANGAETGRARIRTIQAGTEADRFLVDLGLTSPSVTGGDKGANTINVAQIYEANVRVATQTDLTAKAAIAGQTFTGDIGVDKTGAAVVQAKGTTSAFLTADAPATINAGLRLSRGGSKRFEIRLSTDAESGSNAGSNLNIFGFADDGTTTLFAGVFDRANRTFVLPIAPRVGTISSSEVIWHAGNDGPASGLNADLLDNFHASSFVRTINTVSPDGSGNVALTVAGIGGVALSSVVTAGTGSQTAPSGSTYWNGSATPTTSDRRRIDTATVSHTATATGRRLRVTYQANFVPSSDVTINNVTLGLALFRDSDANAIDWVHISPGHRANGTDIYSTPDSVHASFIVTAPDASSHTYHVAVISRSSGAVIDVGDLSRRHLSIQEYAA